MKHVRFGWLGLLLVGAAVLSGCASSKELVITEPVGPLPSAMASKDTVGSLIVYSGWDGLDTLDAEHPKHTAYVIASEEGKKLKLVRNRCGSFEGDPDVVSLAPGRYWIEAEATNVGSIKIAAVVHAGQRTVVYLDGTTEPIGLWPSGTNWIWQPNGLVVGWRDQTNSPLTARAAVSR